MKKYGSYYHYCNASNIGHMTHEERLSDLIKKGFSKMSLAITMLSISIAGEFRFDAFDIKRISVSWFLTMPILSSVSHRESSTFCPSATLYYDPIADKITSKTFSSQCSVQVVAKTGQEPKCSSAH